jgi:hypothetical protein
MTSLTFKCIVTVKVDVHSHNWIWSEYIDKIRFVKTVELARKMHISPYQYTINTLRVLENEGRQFQSAVAFCIYETTLTLW